MRASWPTKFIVGIAAGLSSALLFAGAARFAPEVVLDQSPMDCWNNCPAFLSAPLVSIQRKGIYVGARSATESSLPKVLREEYKKVSGRWVFVRADADVTYGDVLRICQLIEASGFCGRVRIINEDLE